VTPKSLTGRPPSQPALQNISPPDTIDPRVREIIKLAEDVLAGRTSPLVAWMKLEPETRLRPSPDLTASERTMLAIANTSEPPECPICEFEKMYGKKR